MHSQPRISRVRLVPARGPARDDGILGWASFALDGSVLVDGVALRRTLDGRLAFSWPERRGHAVVRPLDDAARLAIESQLLEQLGPWLRGGAA